MRELRCEHRQTNGRLDSHSDTMTPRPAAIDGTRHDPSQSSRTPSRSNDREGGDGLSEPASDPQAQKKSTIGSTKLGETKRSIWLEAKDTAHGSGEQQAEAPEQCGQDGSAVR